MNCPKNNKGFTLVELLVVITIIGILAVGGLSLFASAQQKARDSVRQTDLRALLTSVEQINLDRVGGGTTCGEGNGFPEDKTVSNFRKKIIDYGYLDPMPRDPTNAGASKYRYIAASDCDAYEISTKFEHAANAAKHDKDTGLDPNRYELGTPNCLGGNPTKCSSDTANTGNLDTSTSATDIDEV